MLQHLFVFAHSQLAQEIMHLKGWVEKANHLFATLSALKDRVQHSKALAKAKAIFGLP
jgi:hypothetical protein